MRLPTFYEQNLIPNWGKTLCPQRHSKVCFEELKTFNEQVNPMLNIISENTRENQELITLRDWLLPMLMNGQATISD